MKQIWQSLCINYIPNYSNRIGDTVLTCDRPYKCYSNFVKDTDVFFSYANNILCKGLTCQENSEEHCWLQVRCYARENLQAVPASLQNRKHK